MPLGRSAPAQLERLLDGHGFVQSVSTRKAAPCSSFSLRAKKMVSFMFGRSAPATVAGARGHEEAVPEIR
jgi:hypothetical protein